MLTHHPLTLSQKREICSWRYEGEYSAYNLPSFEQMQKNQSGFMNPDREKDYIGFSINETLVGYVNLREEPTEIFVGIGVRPDFCNQGIGSRVIQIVCDLAQKRHPGKPLYLIVRTWNRRAIRCYERAGFRIDGEAYSIADRGMFYKMTHT